MSREARAMLAQALAEEQALSPDASRRQRLKRAMLQGLALAGAGGAATAKAASAAPLLALGKSFGVGLLVSGSVLGGAQLLMAPVTTPGAPPRAAVAAPSQNPVAPPRAPQVAVESPEPMRTEPEQAGPRSPASPPASAPSAAPALSAELALLNAAQAALRDGRPGQALALLERYDATFPSGQLTNERLAVEVFAACELAHHARARQAASRLLQRDASSALAERVKRACPFQRGDVPP